MDNKLSIRRTGRGNYALIITGILSSSRLTTALMTAFHSSKGTHEVNGFIKKAGDDTNVCTFRNLAFTVSDFFCNCHDEVYLILEPCGPDGVRFANEIDAFLMHNFSGGIAPEISSIKISISDDLKITIWYEPEAA